MQSDNQHIQELWDLFVSDRASAQQVAELFNYIKSAGEQDDQVALIRKAIGPVPAVLPETDDAVVQSILQNIMNANADLRASLEEVKETPVRHISWLRKWGWVAASVIVLLGIGMYMWMIKQTPATPLVVQQVDVAPGHKGAVLTLSDGSQIVLDSLNSGKVATQQGAQITLQNGQLAYDPTGEAASAIAYNIMTTPKGRQFQLTLPDGTRVWLNAASAIRFPTVFTGKERQVEIKGEVYFEVSQNAHKPFSVIVNNKATVEVLGTHFNVHAYEEEGSMNTTLLEGAVRVIKDKENIVLSPGQQARIGQHIQVVNNADIDQVMAWKNGLFNFNGYDLKAVMREIGRWYDLDIVYESEPEPGEVAGEIQRALSLSQVMRIFEKMHIKYRIEGRKLILMR